MYLLRALVSFFLLSSAFAAETTSYEEMIATARALASEGSWERAKERYLEALASAPDEEAGRWCELWMEDATWRSERSNWWREGERWKQRHLARYDELVKPYEQGRARDEFWVAVLTSRADFEANLFLPAAWTHRAAIADHLAMQPPTEAAAERYVAFLQHALEGAQRYQPGGMPLLRMHLSQGARIAANADDRAWCTWQIARLHDNLDHRVAASISRLQQPADRWAAALATATDTRWAPVIRAEELVWRIFSGWSPDLPANTPADIPAMLAELKSAISALANDSSPTASDLRAQLESFVRELGEARLSVEFDNAFRPNSPIRLSYGAAGLSRLDATISRVTPPEWISFEPRDFPDSPTAEPIRQPAGSELIREWKLALPDEKRLAWHSEIVEAAPALPSGFYILSLRGQKTSGEPVTWQRKFTVSELRGLAVLSSATTGKLFTFRGADGAPVAKAPVKGLSRTRTATESWEGTTDSRGAIVVPKLDPLSHALIADVGGEPVWINYRGLFSKDPDALLVDAYTDRPLFRPGETAHWKMVVRTTRDGNFSVPPDVSILNLRITHQGTTLVDTTPVQLNAHGSMHGTIKIPDDAPAGYASLELFRGPPSDDRGVESSTSLFLIDQFVAPAVIGQVEFTGEPQSFRPGQEIAARVKASYFSGGPLAHSTVEVRFSTEENYLFTSNTEFIRWAAQLSETPQRATTDSNGETIFKLSLPSFVPENATLTVSAVITPKATPAVNTAASVTVSSAGLTLDPQSWTSARLARPGAQVTFAARIVDGRGSPTTFKGQAQLNEIRWSEVWLDETGRVVPTNEVTETWRRNGGPAHRVPNHWTLVHAAYSETPVEDLPVMSGADGVISPSFRMPRQGLYRVRVFGEQEILPKADRAFSPATFFSSRRKNSATDQLADERRGVLSVVVADEQTSSLALNPETSAVIAPVAPDAEQPLTILGIVPEGAGRAWASLRGASEVLAEPVSLRGRIARHTFQRSIPLLGAGTVEMSHASIDPTVRASTTTQISAGNKRFKLDVSVTPSLEEQRPGTPAEFTVSVKTSNGHPAGAAELAVRVSDEAVHSLIGNDAEEPAPAFLNIERIVESTTLWSAGERHSLKLVLDPRPGAIRNPDVDDREGLIELMPFELSAAALDPRAMVGAYFKERSQAQDAVPSGAPIVLRSHFSSTAFWAPEIITDAKGEARIAFNYPDNLTRWRIGAYATGIDGTTFGTANTFTRTSLPFQARLNLPRFLIAGDSADPSAVLVNRTNTDLRADAMLEITGDAAATDANDLQRQDLLVPKQSETHTQWSMRAERPGQAQLKLVARAGNESDALALPLPILEDGLQQHMAALARLGPRDKTRNFALDLPATLDADHTEVSVYLSPNYATTLLDALPYLIDYPYGCIEQTMNRFMPAVVVRKTLVDLGLDPLAVERRILAGETPAARKRRESSAGLEHLDEVVHRSLTRLAEAQSPSGYGWWPGADSADLWMTAYVSWGLSLAASAGIEVPDELAASSLQALVRGLQSAGPIDDRVAFAWAALAAARSITDHLDLNSATHLFANAYAARGQLSASGRASLALAAEKFGTREETTTLLRNLDNGAQRVSTRTSGEIVHWGATRNYWRATDSAVEATALTLLALLKIDPTSKLIEPAANWLTLNRRSSQWSSTRDTAFAVLALNAYLRQHGNLDASGEVELLANGKSVERVPFSRTNLLDTASAIPIPIELLKSGANKFQLRRVSGSNPVHATAIGSSWIRGDELQAASHLIEVARLFERQKAEPTLIGTLRITPLPLAANDGTAQAGEEVTARVTLNVPNDLEYVMIEVPKPAGCEPLNALSGWDARLVRISDTPAAKRSTQPGEQEGRPLYREERDDRSVFFLDRIEAGTWELRFGLRATLAGDYRALPVSVRAMYVPEITANSDARRVRIGLAPQP